MRYKPDVLEAWLSSILRACHLPPADATMAAHMLIRSEMRGYATHGLTRVPSYVERLSSGEFNPTPKMRHRAFAGGAALDADRAMGQVAGPRIVQLGLEMLEKSASVLITVDRCGHLGALGIFALQAAEAGAFCVLGQRTPPLLSMPGFARAAIGHNPIAFGCPMPGGDPIVFDIACSVAARGHILTAAREGRPIPEGWAVDQDGQPTTDASRALKGALLPAGGHKGVGIAMMVECLAGAMAAASGPVDAERDVVPAAGAAGSQGAFFWMVKPDAFVPPSAFAASMHQWSQSYLDAGNGLSRIPGSRSADAERASCEKGIEIGVSLKAELERVGHQLAIPLPS